MAPFQVVLASSSPRRGELLAAAGIAFERVAPGVDERPLPNEAPEAHVRRLAGAKAAAALGVRPDGLILAADTVVVVDTLILGKPSDGAQAALMLRTLSGREHRVLTGVAVAGRRGTQIEVAETRVRFIALAPEDIAWYISTVEPMDKAGAYAIQGLASRFVETITGSYSNAVGLPVALAYRMLVEAGMPARAGGGCGDTR